jgi:MoxR-like ATPase
MRISVGYPSKDEEIEILDRRKERKKEEFDVNVVANPERIVEMQKVVENVHVEEDVESYIVDIVQSTRRYSNIEVGASPRGSLAIWQLARANAILRGRDYVIPDDIKAVAISALSHRLILKAGPWLAGAKSEKMIDEILSRTPVPKVMK